jgi:DNA polymerase III subunit alpha
LKVLDRMMAASQAAHQASDRGQLSMFGSVGAAAGISADTFGTLPDEPEISNREKLASEKELTGVYFSDNPLLRLGKTSDQSISHSVSQIDESIVGQMVTIAGVVTSSRVITTKKGDPMAFVQIEDPSGTSELTVFPKTFARTRELWHVESLVKVKAKVESRDGKIQLLCETAAEYEPPQATAEPNGAPHSNAVQFAIPDDGEAALADASAVIEEALEIENMPPPPEEPPDEFSGQWAVDGGQTPVGSQQSAVGSQQLSVISNQAAVASHVRVAEVKPAYAAKSSGGNASAAKPNGGNGHAEPTPAPRAAPSNGPARQLRIYFERTNDQDEDVRRMRELLNLLRSIPGRDRFTFFVPNPQGTVQLDFPNFTTSYAAVQELLDPMVSEWGSMEVQ